MKDTEKQIYANMRYLCICLVSNFFNYNSNRYTYPVFIAALFTIAKTWKQPKYPSTDKWIKKMWYIYTMDFYSAIKKE